jgi:hypothetical protein
LDAQELEDTGDGGVLEELMTNGLVAALAPASVAESHQGPQGVGRHAAIMRATGYPRQPTFVQVP